MAAFWHIVSHSIAELDRCFGGAYRLNRQTTLRNIPEKSSLHYLLWNLSVTNNKTINHFSIILHPPKSLIGFQHTFMVFIQLHFRLINCNVLSFQIQHGVVPIPKSSNKSRLQENFDIFNFELTPGEVTSIDALNTNCRIFTNSQYVSEFY
jgi:hypothetical protein